MANEDHVEILKKGVKFWNNWRKKSNINPDLAGANFYKFNLGGANLEKTNLEQTNLREVVLKGAKLTKANLRRAYLLMSDLEGADLISADLRGADLQISNLKQAKISHGYLFEAILNKATLDQADLEKADLERATLYGTKLRGANLTGVNLTNSKLDQADFSEACLKNAVLFRASLWETRFFGADLTKTNLEETLCIRTDFTNASIESAWVYGASVWNIKSDGMTQKNLKITSFGDTPIITVDNIEVAQFIFLILNNKKIRDVINTISTKGVLILGRFTPERKKILDAIRDKLREYDFVPIMFDFEKVTSKDFTETIKILAGMSRFVIADITNPKSAPLELQATVPDYKLPFLPIIQEGEIPFSMFVDLQQKYNWVLPTMTYSSEETLLKGFKKGILNRAIEADRKLTDEKNAPAPPLERIEDFGD